MSEQTKPNPHAEFHHASELIEPETGPDLDINIDIPALKKSLEEAQQEAKANWEKLLRKEAELQNIQKRASTDVDNARKFGTERMAQELLAVVDSFEQGLLYEKDNQAIQDGMKLTYSVLLEVLAKFGIKEINPQVADAFNPQHHEAIMMQETSEVAPNQILTVVQKGYFIHERILRAARVIVARAPAITEL